MKQTTLFGQHETGPTRGQRWSEKRQYRFLVMASARYYTVAGLHAEMGKCQGDAKRARFLKDILVYVQDAIAGKLGTSSFKCPSCEQVFTLPRPIPFYSGLGVDCPHCGEKDLCAKTYHVEGYQTLEMKPKCPT